MIFILWGFQRYITTFWSCHFSIVDIQACAGDDDHHGPFLARKFAAPAGGVVHLEVAAARRLLLRRTGSPGSRVAEANNIFTCGQKFNIVKQHILGWLVLWNIIYIFFHILGMSSSQLTNSYLSEGWLNHQPVGDVPNSKWRIYRDCFEVSRDIFSGGAKSWCRFLQ